MMDEETDYLISSRVKACVAGKHLPATFADRLTKHLRHRRRMFRLKTMTVVVLLALVALGLLGSFSRSTCESDDRASLVAGNNTPGTEKNLSGWFFLGFFRECLRRGRTGKKKEDDPID
ncbi:MAG: hypothetical protein IKR48_10065 [Kiritimatiellae bacterium]|nr:hypothetical protein [Kiritimatiellia bacterium]